MSENENISNELNETTESLPLQHEEASDTEVADTVQSFSSETTQESEQEIPAPAEVVNPIVSPSNDDEITNADCNDDSVADIHENTNEPLENQQQSNVHTQRANPPYYQTANQYYAPPAQPYQQPQQSAYAYPQQPVQKVKKKSVGKAIFIAVASILLVCVVGIFAVILTKGSNLSSNPGNGLSDVPSVSAVSSAESEGEGLSSAEVYQKIFKSSVCVLAYKQTGGELGAIGSGVICQVDDSNKYTYIVTCAHVINDSSYNIKVELWDGSVHTAEVVNYDDSNDIGVIRIAKTGLVVAEFGDSEELQPGATVYAIGSPYSSKFAGTFTRGMVSANNRLVTTQTSYQLSCIQHDAPINHGNSGGALVNAYGQVVGINALKISAEGYEGLGFAVPSSTVIKVINSIIETGIAPKAAKLGISYVQAIYYSQFLSDFIEENDLPAGSILIADITEDSSLANTELKENDIVTEVNGQPLTTPDLLVQLIQNSNVGDSFELTVVRIMMNADGTDYVDMQTFTVTATLVEKTTEDESQSDDAQEDFYEYFGDDSGNYEDFYEYFYDYFYGNGNIPQDDNQRPGNDNQFHIPE